MPQSPRVHAAGLAANGEWEHLRAHEPADDLDAARTSIKLPGTNGFPPAQSSHLIGIGDYTTPWQREWSLTLAGGDESAVLFALDQFCLIGYSLPIAPPTRRSWYLGS